LKADFVAPEKVKGIADRFAKNAFVFEVSYDSLLVNSLTTNIQRISFWLLIICAFFGLIAILLINSSIRLSIYAKRFNIKTMQMVGATKSFIRRPFIWNSIKLGMIGALLALAGLSASIYFIDQKIATLELMTDYLTLLYIGGGVIIMAFLITWLSTFLATQRFLNLQTDELYY
jgi:cell division transport system permease protein